MAYVSLSNMPSPKKEYVVNFERLAGGLNLEELDYRIGNNESPEMLNLLWQDGVLSSRDGQVWVDETDAGVPNFVTAYEGIWNGYMFIHAGTKLYRVLPLTGERTLLYTGDSDMTVKGKFFAYNERLYYKTKGYYVVIENNNGVFTASDVVGYSPITYINCSPVNGSGTVYQPENRLSANKTLWYTAAYSFTVVPSAGLNAVLEDAYFRAKTVTPGTYVFEYTTQWELDGEPTNPYDYGITVIGTPAQGSTITVIFRLETDYVLPVKDVTIHGITVDGVEKIEESLSVEESRPSLHAAIDISVWRNKVTVSGIYTFIYDYDGATWTLDGAPVDGRQYGISTEDSPSSGDTIIADYERGNFWTDTAVGRVVFFVPPPITYPETLNTVHITYSKENELAYQNIMDCRYVEVYGGTGSLCIVMAGCYTQPNAYFWNGQTSISMDASYFPMTQYQLAGDAIDPITGFGKQQGYLIIFKEGSVGRTTLSTANVNERMTIDLPYVPINAKIGCDLPNTIQLIENNLTWCNTTRGVQFLANTSSAYENNVICISTKVNDSNASWNPGLLYYVRRAKDKGEPIISHDDEKRYWLCVSGVVWVWDYDISNYKNPSWFFLDNIRARAIVQDHTKIWHFNENSKLTKFENNYYDYDMSENGPGGIKKVFRFATQYFGTYDVLKTVNSVIINTRSGTDTWIKVKYITDYEDRYDLRDLFSQTWRLVPRDLSSRHLSGAGFAYVFRRKPHCRRIRYFALRLENDKPAMDMTIVSAQIYYIYQGRYR